LAQRTRRQKRKQRQATRPGTAEPAPAREKPAAYARAEAKNRAVRESLVPLADGERPGAVTIAAILAVALVVIQIPLFLTWDGDKRPAPVGFVVFLALMLTMAWGMWNVKYWAVLGFQALLALTVLIFSLLLMQASNVVAALVSLVAIVGGGTLFWFMVKAMARIQMPDRS
jgi:hypothetical protein